ncbi:MAG: transglutaminase-like domain-containing protein [Rhodanobacteraceae bacterium]
MTERVRGIVRNLVDRSGGVGVLAFLALVASLARAAPPSPMWYSVLLDGRKIGSFESTREIRGEGASERVVTSQKLDLVLERAGVQMALADAETSEESPSGEPLSFLSVARLSGSQTRIEGKVHDGRIDVTVQSGGGPAQLKQRAWPAGALLPEGLRLAGVHAGLEPGTHYRALAFQPSTLDAVTVDTQVGLRETLDLPSGPATLSAIGQTLDFPGAPATSRAWVDSDQTVYKMVMPILGVDLTLLACDRACAQAPNQSSDLFAHMLMKSPRPLSTAERTRDLRYTLRANDDGAALDLPDTDEQQVVRKGRKVILTVRKHATGGTEPAPQAIDRESTDWLQSSAPEIVSLAHIGAGAAETPLERMQKLQEFVRGYIKDKTLDVGYASALEVARKPEGDCTEHAVLLAALGRALGIPTRVVDGLAYAPAFGGAEQVFVPHAWVQAWVDARWQSFDAALPGFDTGHIALSVGDGDPWRFYAGLDALGRMDLQRIETLDGVSASHAVTRSHP